METHIGCSYMDANNGNSLEAHAFLQLIANFCIASGFNEEEIHANSSGISKSSSVDLQIKIFVYNICTIN